MRPHTLNTTALVARYLELRAELRLAPVARVEHECGWIRIRFDSGNLSVFRRAQLIDRIESYEDRARIRRERTQQDAWEDAERAHWAARDVLTT